MLHENLKALRKAAGISQEELAIRLHVVRQTISKWEKGLSVPDAQMLIRIAEVFDVPVSELLGAGFESRAEQSPVAEQLSRINKQLAIRNRRARRIWKVVAGVVIAIIVVNVLLMVLSIAAYSVYSDAPAITETETIADQPERRFADRQFFARQYFFRGASRRAAAREAESMKRLRSSRTAAHSASAPTNHQIGQPRQKCSTSSSTTAICPTGWNSMSRSRLSSRLPSHRKKRIRRSPLSIKRPAHSVGRSIFSIHSAVNRSAARAAEEQRCIRSSAKAAAPRPTRSGDSAAL